MYNISLFNLYLNIIHSLSGHDRSTRTLKNKNKTKTKQKQTQKNVHYSSNKRKRKKKMVWFLVFGWLVFVVVVFSNKTERKVFLVLVSGFWLVGLCCRFQ